jgi:hypothetical protein
MPDLFSGFGPICHRAELTEGACQPSPYMATGARLSRPVL